MKHRLAALALVAAAVSASPLALADVPGPTTTSSNTGGAGGSSSGTDESSGGCSAAPGNAGGSAAILIGLGLLLASPLVRRRRS